MSHVTAHIFSSTGEAYDATQCSDLIKTGDLLFIPSERVIGVAYTWPFAVTREHGKLHTPITTLAALTASFEAERNDPRRYSIVDGIEAAAHLARQLNWETCE